MFFRKDYKRLKVENYTQVLEQTERRSEYCPGLPMHLWINTSNICNLNCIMCGRNREENPSVNPIDHLEREIFQKLVRECFPALGLLDLSLTGEATLSKYFREELKAAQKYQVKVKLNTNATLLGEDSIMKLLLENVWQVIVSLDGATKATFESIRLGSNFEKVVENLCRFNKLRQEIYPKKRPLLLFSIVIMRKNIEELPGIIRMIKEWNPDGGVVVHMVPIYPFMEPQSLKHYPELSDCYLKLAQEEARKLGLGLHFPPLSTEKAQSPGPEPVFCPIPWSQSLILEDGRVTTCCNPVSDRPVCGNLKHQSFQEIWNGPVYRALRRGMALGSPPSMCRNCYWQDQGLAGAAVEKFIF